MGAPLITAEVRALIGQETLPGSNWFPISEEMVYESADVKLLEFTRYVADS